MSETSKTPTPYSRLSDDYLITVAMQRDELTPLEVELLKRLERRDQAICYPEQDNNEFKIMNSKVQLLMSEVKYRGMDMEKDEEFGEVYRELVFAKDEYRKAKIASASANRDECTAANRMREAEKKFDAVVEKIRGKSRVGNDNG